MVPTPYHGAAGSDVNAWPRAATQLRLEPARAAEKPDARGRPAPPDRIGDGERGRDVAGGAAGGESDLHAKASTRKREDAKPGKGCRHERLRAFALKRDEPQRSDATEDAQSP